MERQEHVVIRNSQRRRCNITWGSKLLTVAGLVSLFSSATAAQTNYIGFGANCGQYTAWHDTVSRGATLPQDPPAKHDNEYKLTRATLTWLQGYLAGVRDLTIALTDAKADMTIPPVSALDLWLTDYCREHPAAPIREAALQLAREIRNETLNEAGIK